MYEYWFFVRNSAGFPMRVTLRADTNYNALQMAKALYGSQLMSEGASRV